LQALLADPAFPTDTDSAFAELFALWGVQYDASRGDPCLQAEEQRLRCLFQPRGSIGQLRTLNLPAIMTLTDTHGDGRNVVMTGLGYREVELAAPGGAAVKVELSELTHYWF